MWNSIYSPKSLYLILNCLSLLLLKAVLTHIEILQNNLTSKNIHQSILNIINKVLDNAITSLDANIRNCTSRTREADYIDSSVRNCHHVLDTEFGPIIIFLVILCMTSNLILGYIFNI